MKDNKVLILIVVATLLLLGTAIHYEMKNKQPAQKVDDFTNHSEIPNN